ncbi:GntR family transcriptional regulator [Thermocatellispora tengchongensis]|uniref:GntR family transcriptional regulator n=1 Tax=Thermocatellispora tengchongensis TaxID=1073253 RepID=UPI00363B161A
MEGSEGEPDGHRRQGHPLAHDRHRPTRRHPGRPLSPGAALPSEPELVRRYGVSRPTVRKAIDTLVTDGLAYVMRGRGSFVRPSRNDR